MENMKKLSEVCKITGITRRALQIYDKMDLLKPTAKNECNYWLYNDEAVAKLIFIKILKEAGYELKEIKNILESQECDFSNELDKVISELEIKRVKIAGFINYLKSMKVIAEMPEEMISAMPEVDYATIYQNKNFNEVFEESRLLLGKIEDTNFEEENIYLLAVGYLLMVGKLKDKAVDDKGVQVIIEEVYKIALNKINQIAEQKFEKKISEKKSLKIAYEMVMDAVTSQEDFKKIIETQCEKGAFDFVVQAIEYYYNNLNLS